MMPQVEGLFVLYLGPVADLFPALGSIQSSKSSMSLSKWVEAVFRSMEYAVLHSGGVMRCYNFSFTLERMSQHTILA